MNEQKVKEGFKLKVFVRGIKKKCRKVDSHLFDIGWVFSEQAELTEETKKDVLANVQKEMKTLNGNLVDVHFDWIEIVKETDCLITRWEPFNERNKKFRLNIQTMESFPLK